MKKIKTIKITLLHIFINIAALALYAAQHQQIAGMRECEHTYIFK